MTQSFFPPPQPQLRFWHGPSRVPGFIAITMDKSMQGKAAVITATRLGVFSMSTWVEETEQFTFLVNTDGYTRFEQTVTKAGYYCASTIA